MVNVIVVVNRYSAADKAVTVVNVVSAVCRQIVKRAF